MEVHICYQNNLGLGKLWPLNLHWTYACFKHRFIACHPVSSFPVLPGPCLWPLNLTPRTCRFPTDNPNWQPMCPRGISTVFLPRTTNWRFSSDWCYSPLSLTNQKTSSYPKIHLHFQSKPSQLSLEFISPLQAYTSAYRTLPISFVNDSNSLNWPLFPVSSTPGHSPHCFQFFFMKNYLVILLI